MDHTIWDPLWLSFFFTLMLFKIHPGCNLYQYCTPCYCPIIFCCIYHILCFHSSACGHLGGFLLLTLLSDAAVNGCVHFCVGMYSVLHHMVTLFNLLKNCWIVFQSSCTILHSQHQCVRVPVFTYLTKLVTACQTVDFKIVVKYALHKIYHFNHFLEWFQWHVVLIQSHCYITGSTTHSPHSPRPWQPLFYFLPLWICLLIERKWSHNICPLVSGLFHLA